LIQVWIFASIQTLRLNEKIKIHAQA
jgi:hypothetical protein